MYKSFLSAALFATSACFPTSPIENNGVISRLHGQTFDEVVAELGEPDPSQIYLYRDLSICMERNQRWSEMDPVIRVMMEDRGRAAPNCSVEAGRWQGFPGRTFQESDLVVSYVVDDRRAISYPASATTTIFGNTAYTTINPGGVTETGGICRTELLFSNDRLVAHNLIGDGCP